MSYIINKTDGSTLTELVDGTIDQSTTDLTLVGKNAVTYGEAFNENFIKLLENFANISEPSNPIEGQLWYDTADQRLKVYNGSSFKATGGTIISSSIPSSIAAGDIWIDSLRQQLYFNDGTSTKLAGPIYSSQQGISGFIVEEIIDTNNLPHNVVFLYVSGTLLGLFSKDSFTPRSVIPGYGTDPTTSLSYPVAVGYNETKILTNKFDVASSKSYALIQTDGTLRTAETFLSGIGNSSTSGTISIQNTLPLVLGVGGAVNGQSEIRVQGNEFQINANTQNQNFNIKLFYATQLTSMMFINGAQKRIGLFTNTPTTSLDVDGDTRIRGSLTVEGNLTTISTTNLEITDKLIEIAKTATPTDVNANGGGISLKGTTDKTITWSSTGSNWTSSENFNLASGKTFKINNVDVLSATSLLVTSAPGITSLGTLVNLDVDQLNLNNSTISYVNPSSSNGTITLIPKGTGTVDVSSKKISNLALPDVSTDAANKSYVDSTVSTDTQTVSLTTTNLSNTDIAVLLGKIFPVPSERLQNTKARVLCYDLSTSGPTVVAATAAQSGITYIITSIGGTDFMLIGSPNNNVGQVFTKNSTAATGAGTVTPYIRQFSVNAGLIWQYDNTNL